MECFKNIFNRQGKGEASDVALSLGHQSDIHQPWVQFPAPHRPGIVADNCDPRWRQDDQKFKVILGWKCVQGQSTLQETPEEGTG